MRFYQQQHRFYCGVDLHARSMWLTRGCNRFPASARCWPGNFLSYARLVRPGHESAGKAAGWGNKKIGNARDLE